MYTIEGGNILKNFLHAVGGGWIEIHPYKM